LALERQDLMPESDYQLMVILGTGQQPPQEGKKQCKHPSNRRSHLPIYQKFRALT